MRKLVLSLMLIAALSLLGFFAELLYILHYRRKLRRAAAPARSPAERPSRTNLLSALCLERNRSRVEPAARSPPATKPREEEEECDLERWRAACLGPSRVLYTIKEEEREELADSDLEKGLGFGSDKEEGPETPYYTPASSPARV